MTRDVLCDPRTGPVVLMGSGALLFLTSLAAHIKEIDGTSEWAPMIGAALAVFGGTWWCAECRAKRRGWLCFVGLVGTVVFGSTVAVSWGSVLANVFGPDHPSIREWAQISAMLSVFGPLTLFSSQLWLGDSRWQR